MAKQGAVPVFAVYSTFLQRSYDMLLHDIAIDGLHVVLAVDRAGLVGDDGETHHGVFDVAYLNSVPGITVYSPSNFTELDRMLEAAVCRYTCLLYTSCIPFCGWKRREAASPRNMTHRSAPSPSFRVK